MKIEAYSLIALTNILAKHFPPPGWKVEVGIKPLGEEWEVEISSPMTQNSWCEWEDDVFVFPLVNQLHNVPGFPEEWGSDWDEALWNLLHDIVEKEILPEFQDWVEAKEAGIALADELEDMIEDPPACWGNLQAHLQCAWQEVPQASRLTPEQVATAEALAYSILRKQGLVK